MKSGIAFHCHHEELCEFVYDYDGWVNFIKTNKPEEERELRLRLFKLIPDDLLPGKESGEWEAYEKAWKACDKARDAYEKAWKACDKARDACEKAWEACDKARDAYEKAWEACDKAGDAYRTAFEAFKKAWKAYKKAWGKQIVALHEELCPNCPWDGKTIFV